MTTIVNLYGGPGTGKSTTAAYLYYALKTAGHNAELVREYVKDWAWEGRRVGAYDQLYLFGKQMRQESLIYGAVSHLVTDSPVLLCAFYASRYSPPAIANGVVEAVKAFYAQAEADGHTHRHIFLRRTKPYNPAGRFESEAQARQIDEDLRGFLDLHRIAYSVSGTAPADLESICNSVTR